MVMRNIICYVLLCQISSTKNIYIYNSGVHGKARHFSSLLIIFSFFPFFFLFFYNLYLINYKYLCIFVLFYLYIYIYIYIYEHGNSEEIVTEELYYIKI
uniref:Uncharacterized protein n=1 Tax=Cannabis sativa TaxID=3483 RepID=A0A803RAP1_CANSA